jgi:hypothetical protein
MLRESLMSEVRQDVGWEVACEDGRFRIRHYWSDMQQSETLPLAGHYFS